MVCTPNNHGHYDTQTQNQSGQSIYKLDLIAAQLFCGVCFFYRRVFLSPPKIRMKGKKKEREKRWHLKSQNK
jgi:hypothetical protein